MRFKLRFLPHRVGDWSDKYSYPEKDDAPGRIGETARERGYLDKPDLVALAMWKTKRSQKLIASNPDDFVRAVTGVALTTENERLAIEVLLLLRGVSWPTASVILHFCAERPYPILDYRALWSLSSEATEADYDYALWESYVRVTREWASNMKVSMRTLDRALWTFSKYNQPARAGT